MTTAARHDPVGVLQRSALAVVAVLVARPPALALDSQESVPDQVVITAERQTDAILTEKVETALREDPYLLADHVTVSAEHGVLRLEGIVFSIQDMRRMLILARRIAGKRRVINDLELVLEDDNGQG